MTDIFDEVGEDLRRDQLRSLWKRYGVVLVGVAILIVLATAAWRIYVYWDGERAAAAGDSFEVALTSAKAGDHAALAAALSAYAGSAPGQYAVLARFRAASEHAAMGETDNAVAAFDALAGDKAAPQEIRDLAAVRAALAALDKEDAAAIAKRLQPYLSDISPWRATAREILAFAAVKAGDWPQVRDLARRLSDDTATSSDIRRRAQILKGLADSALGPEKPDGAAS